MSNHKEIWSGLQEIKSELNIQEPLAIYIKLDLKCLVSETYAHHFIKVISDVKSLYIDNCFTEAWPCYFDWCGKIRRSEIKRRRREAVGYG